MKTALLAVYFGWLLFYFEDLSLLGTALGSLLCLNGNPLWDLTAGLSLLNNVFFLAVCILACLPVIPLLDRQLERLSGVNPAWSSLRNTVDTIAPAILLFLSFLSLIGNTYNPFLYFQF